MNTFTESQNETYVTRKGLEQVEPFEMKSCDLLLVSLPRNVTGIPNLCNGELSASQSLNFLLGFVPKSISLSSGSIYKHKQWTSLKQHNTTTTRVTQDEVTGR